MTHLRREHVVGIRTDLPSCKVRVGRLISYPCDNLCVLSDPTTTRSRQCFVETTKSNHSLVAYDVSNDGTLLALAENDPTGNISSLVSLYSLHVSTTPKKITCSKKKVIRIERSRILHISLVDSTHVLVLGAAPEYSLTLWSTGATSANGSLIGTPTKGASSAGTKHPGACLASIKLATPSGKSIYRADVSPKEDDAGNTLVCVTGDGVLRLFRLSTANNTFRPATVNLKRKQQNYIAQKWLSSGQIALGTDSGEILIVEHNSTQSVLKLPEPCTAVTCLGESSKGHLIVGSDKASMHLYEASQDVEARFALNTSISLATTNDIGSAGTTITSLSTSMEGNEEVVYAATSDNRLTKVPLGSALEKSCSPKIQPAIPTLLSTKESSCTHSMDTCLWSPLIAVSSSAVPQNNCVQIWNYRTRELEASKSFGSDCPIQAICFHPSSFQLVVGSNDKLIACDLVRSINNDSGCPSIIKISGEIVAPSTIRHCQYSNGGQYIAVSCGPTLTVYDAYTLNEQCTLRGHSADIVAIHFQEGDQKICTIGSDGVLCIWSISSGRKLLRHVNALSSYTCGVIDSKFSKAIVSTESSVSKIDLNVQEKISSEETLVNAPWSKMQMTPCGKMMVGAAATHTEGDASIFITPLPQGDDSKKEEPTQLVAKSAIRQISSLSLSGQNLFVTSGSGSMHHFLVEWPGKHPSVAEEEVAVPPNILSDQVLVSATDLDKRRVLIESLENQLLNVQHNNSKGMQTLDDKHRDALKAIHEQNEHNEEDNQRRCQEAMEQRSKLELDLNDVITKAEEAHTAQTQRIEQSTEEKINAEIQRTETMKTECATKTSQWERDIKSKRLQTADEIEGLASDFSERTENEVRLQKEITGQHSDLLDKHHKLMESLERTGDDEVTGIMLERERELFAEQKATRHLREEQAILKAKLDSLASDLDEQKDTIESLQEKEAELMSSIDEAKECIRQRQNDMQSQDDELFRLKDEGTALQASCEELSQNQSNLKKTIADRGESLAQIRAEIVDKEKSGAQLQTNLAASKRAHSNVELAIANLKDKSSGLDRERQRQESRIDERTAYTLQLEKDIRDLVSAKKSGHGELNAKLVPICTKYLLKTCDSSKTARVATDSRYGGENKKESELQRRERHLRKKINTIKEAITKAEKKHTQDMARLRWQQKVLKQNLAEMASSSVVVSSETSSPVEGKENSINDSQSS